MKYTRFISFKWIVTLALTLSLSGMQAFAGSSADSVKWDMEYDVVIVGSGFAGVAAAIESKKKNIPTLLIEKMAVYGGNSAINGGAFAVAGSPLQKKLGVKDSVDLMVNDMLKAGRGLNHPELLKVIAEGTYDAYMFTLDYGVKYEDRLFQFGGHSVMRTLQTEHAVGGDILVPMIEGAKKLGVDFKNRCMLEEIILDESGGVNGIVVRDRYIFKKEDSGVLKRIRIKKGLVMATGGFSADVKFRMSQVPKLDASLETTNHPGAASESIAELLLAGAKPVQLDQIQDGPWASPDEKGFGTAPQFLQQSAFPFGILVDVRTGKRFVNENADRKTRADAIRTRVDKDGNPVYPVAFTVEEATGGSPSLPNALKYGVAHKFETIKELAEFYGIPYKGLKEQVDIYNSMVEAGKDTQFDKPILKKVLLEKGPFYAARAWTKVHHTMGGVGIDTGARVLSMKTGKPIPGLYAAGEVTGGIHGASRLGSCAIADCLVMGRIAGKNAASEN